MAHHQPVKNLNLNGSYAKYFIIGREEKLYQFKMIDGLNLTVHTERTDWL